MNGRPAADTALLELAVGYALCAVRPVTPRLYALPTPCRRWNLGALLRHTDDSLSALYEGLGTGRVQVGPQPAGGPVPSGSVPGDPGRYRFDPADAFRARADRLLGMCATCDEPGRPVAVADLPLTAEAVARTGALEIAVHAWDVAQATELPRPVPAGLATALLRTARQLVPGPYARRPLFGPPVAVSADADPGDRLVAFLGREPQWMRKPHRPTDRTPYYGG